MKTYKLSRGTGMGEPKEGTINEKKTPKGLVNSYYGAPGRDRTHD